MKLIDRLLLGIAAAAIVGGAALAAEDTLKPGKWEFVTEIHGPKPPPLPPGGKLPPGVQMRPDGGMNVTHSVCVNAKNPAPLGPPKPPQGPGQPNCKLDKMERNGGDVHWAMTCSGQQGTTHAESDAHYRGDTMDADVRTHTAAANGTPADVTQHTTGRYLGPCSGK
jgi:hypothetical protein